MLSIDIISSPIYQILINLQLLKKYTIMIQSATFSMEESENVLKTFLIDYDISKVIQKFVKRQPIHLRQHLKRIIRQTIINIQAHLFKAQKIPSLLLYDNQSDQMFEAFMNLKDIIPESQKDNFYLNFVNMKSQGCRILRFGRTDYHVSINSEQRERIYARFISYTEHHSLYKYAITRKDEDSNVESPPYSDPCKLFSPRDLQFVFKTYCMYKGDVVKMAQFFKQKGVDDSRFQIESLEQSIPNLMLIGYYFAHKRSAQMNNIQPIRWAQFRDKYPLPEECDFKAKVIWIRIAIRNDPEPNQLKWIQKIQKKKILPTNKQRRPQLPKKGPNIDHKKWRKGKECVLSKIKQQLKETIVNPNLEVASQYGIYDTESVRSLKSHSRSNRDKKKSQRNTEQRRQLSNPPQQEQFDDRLSKKELQPQFIKRIQKQSESQIIVEEKDQRDVVWQQIPDKSSSGNPVQGQNHMSMTPSVRYYSQKVHMDKASIQQSLQSDMHKIKGRKVIYKNKKKRSRYDDSEGEEENYDEYQGQGMQQQQSQSSESEDE